MPYRDRIVDLTGLNNNKNIQAPAGEGKTLRATVGNKGNNQLYSLQSKRIGEKDEYILTIRIWRMNILDTTQRRTQTSSPLIQVLQSLIHVSR
jgi:hypothetical protein